MVTSVHAHSITIWARDLNRTRWAWSCRCGVRSIPQGAPDPHPQDLHSHTQARQHSLAHTSGRPITQTPETPDPIPTGVMRACLRCFAPTDHPSHQCPTCRG
jgi:hypothetical protein